MTNAARDAAARAALEMGRARRRVALALLIAVGMQGCSGDGGGAVPRATRLSDGAPVTGEGIFVRPVNADTADGTADDDRATGRIDPHDTLLIVFNHGSTYEGQPDPCQPDPARPGSTTPPLLQDLAGRRVGRLRVVVYAYCTPSKVGTFHAVTAGVGTMSAGELKLERRVRDIAARVARFRAEGVPAERIVVAGQSAGGFASLLLARRAPAEVAAAIAFAPAFAGERAIRPPAWQQAHDLRLAELTAPRTLPALVYGFDGDSFDPPTEMAALATVPGLVYRRWTAADGVACRPFPPHAMLHNDCFRRAEAEGVLRFLADRIR